MRALAWAERARLADVAAKHLLDEAARIARRHGLDESLADVLISRAAVNQELGALGAAQRDLDTAGELGGGTSKAVELAFQRAVLHQNIGRLGPAAAAYRELLGRPDTPQRIMVIAANNLAMIDAQHGRHGDALRLLDDAARRADEVGPALVAMVLETRAWVTVQSGRLAEGLRLFDEAGRAHEAAGLPLGEHHVEYADALIDLRLLPEAGAAARTATEIFRRNGVPLMGAEAELRVAQLAMLAGNAAEAETAARAAAETFQRQRRGAWRARAALVAVEARLRRGAASAADLREARRASRALEAARTRSAAVQAYVVAGRVAAHLGRAGDAETAYRRAADLSRGTPILVRLRGAVAAALAARLRTRDADVLAHCRRGLADLARHRAALPSVELRALASGHGEELGQFGLEAVVRGGTPRRVLEWLERTRAAALLAVEPAGAADVEDDLEALRAVHTELDVLAQQPDRGADAPASLVARQMMIESRIRRATWHRGSAAAAGDSAAAALPTRLRELLAGRILIEYGIMGDRLLAVVVEPRRSRVVPLGPTGPVLDHLRALLFALRRMTQPRPGSLSAARQSADVRVERLRELLIRPLAPPPDAELVVVPVGPLHGVPWSALYDGPLSLAPSARFWARSRQATMGRPAGGLVVLVEGPHLPGATTEVRRLRRLYPRATVVVPPASTAAAVQRILDGADLVHFACHGRLRADNPMFSSLMLSDGPLTVQELEARGVAPHRLVLASCQSGADTTYAGDEVLGFVSALIARGTAGIVASVAAVPDVAAVGLMCALHERLINGRTLAHALYEARDGLDRDEPGAYVSWCTFGAHGAA
ncbi:CHAT domain-containing protein [Phytohabitans rumicis]|uniref:CHAT domain-containing protein n=1 Tax=Phytohabitans rumicis TaxID=1076125 RepID=A0A6V8LKU2_9ACTN|nr:CHAT domain-containing protein [Phytohabitans rumicis]